MSQATAQAPAPAKPQRPEPPPIPPEFQADAIMKMGSSELIKMLNDPGSTQFQKSKACMRLAMVGDKAAVPALAALLPDPKFSHYARFALVPIPDASVDDALRTALGTVKGNDLIGVIDSIGQRKDPKAVDALTRLMSVGDQEIALAAIAALGLISGRTATDVLLGGLAKTTDPVRKAVAAACLVSAEEWFLKGDRQQALSLYERLSQTDIPKPIRLAAMNSIILAETSPSRPK